MKTFFCSVALTLSIAATTVSADAKGCIKGAMIGAAAGHLVHHTLIGAATGCVIGHHEAANAAQQQNERQQTQPANPASAPAKQQ